MKLQSHTPSSLSIIRSKEAYTTAVTWCCTWKVIAWLLVKSHPDQPWLLLATYFCVYVHTSGTDFPPKMCYKCDGVATCAVRKREGNWFSACSRPWRLYLLHLAACAVNVMVFSASPLLPLSPPTGGHWVHGPVQSPHPRVRRGAPGEDHRRLPGPVPLVRGRQAPTLPALDQALRLRAATASHLQVVPRFVHENAVAVLLVLAWMEGGSEGPTASLCGSEMFTVLWLRHRLEILLK